jgi:uroporphyrin-3 C-methyltransferase
VEADKKITTPESKETVAKPSKVQEKSSGPGWMALGFVLAIALAGALAAAYLWQFSGQQQQSLQASVEAAIQRVDSEVDQARALQRQIDQQKLLAAQSEKNLRAEITVLQGSLARQQQRMQSLSTTDRNDWLLAEVEYLIRLANQRILMGEDVASASKLLRAADEIIREMDDSGLYPVRKVIAEDIAALNTAAKLDVEGLYLQLAAVAKQAALLRLYQRPEFETVSVELEQAGDWQQTMGAGFAAAWQKLSAYIKIHKRDEKYQRSLAPEYEAAVRQNVQLMFEQAQLALLSGNQKFYSDSLARVGQWLREYYTLDIDATATVIASVDDLQKQSIVTVMPDISRSLRDLKTYLETVHSLPAAENVSEPAP